MSAVKASPRTLRRAEASFLKCFLLTVIRGEGKTNKASIAHKFMQAADLLLFILH
jgi:hypothetical protein